MISLAFEFGAVANQKVLDDWSGIDEMTLRYDAFVGDVRIVIDGVDFSTAWGWVTILDFAVSLRHSLRSLRSAPSASLDFTESEARISFTRADGRVVVGASYVTESASAELDELIDASEGFLADTITALCDTHPGLDRNPFIQRELG